MSKDLEARLLASVPSIGHFQRLEDKGVTESSFDHYGPMFRYMKNIIDEHEHMPKLIDLKSTFNVPSHVQRKPEEFEWLLEEFLALSTIQRIQSTLDANIERYGDSPRDLLSGLVKDLTGLAVPEKRHASITDSTAIDRIQAYEDKITDEPLIGIPTGLSYFDVEYGIGWLPGELAAVIGRPYIGKSWMTLWHAVIAWRFGKRILFLSPEMSQDEAEARVDVLACGLAGVHVNYNDLIRGIKLNEKQKAVLQDMSKRGDWITLCSDEGRAMSLGEIPRYVRQYSPDVLVVDGMTLIGSEAQEGWSQAKDLSYGLKNIATSSNIVIIVNQWANQKAGDGSTPPTLGQVYMGDSLSQSADRVMGLSRAKGGGLRVNVQKFRKGRPMARGRVFQFEPDDGIIREKEPSENLSENAEPTEAVGNEDLEPIP